MGPAELLLRHFFTYCLLLPTTLKKAKYWYSICNAILAPCPDPGVPGNGNRRGDDFRHAKSVTFSCKEDYELEGDATISCYNGDWTSKTPLCISSCKQEEGWENSRQSCKSSTTFRVCVTFENSLRSPSVKMRLCKHGKSVLLLL